MLQLASGFLVQHRTGEQIRILVALLGQKHQLLPSDALHTAMLSYLGDAPGGLLNVLLSARIDGTIELGVFSQFLLHRVPTRLAVEDAIRIDGVNLQFGMVCDDIFQQRFQGVGFILLAVEHHTTQRCSTLSQLRQSNLMVG